MVLPSVFLVGAAKCGTSSLHHYLDQHPAVSMTSDKEPSIFTSRSWRDELPRYGQLLDPSAPVRGESSTNYSKYPAFSDVPGRIAEVVPDALLIYVVGDPIPRCIAHYAQNVAAGIETRAIGEAVSDFDDPRNTYVWAGRYATQLERYLEHFPLSSVLVLDQADLLGDRLTTIRKVFRFLSIDEGFTSPRFEEVMNTRKAQRRLGTVGNRLRRSRPVELYRKLPPGWRRPLSKSTRHLLSRPVSRPELDPGLVSELRALYEDEIARLAALTGTRPAISR